MATTYTTKGPAIYRNVTGDRTAEICESVN